MSMKLAIFSRVLLFFCFVFVFTGPTQATDYAVSGPPLVGLQPTTPPEH